MHPPPFQDSAGFDLLPSKSNSVFNSDDEMESMENGNTRCDSLWVGEVLRNYSQGPCQSQRNKDENLQDLSHGAIGLHWSADQRTVPPLRKRQVSWLRLS